MLQNFSARGGVSPPNPSFFFNFRPKIRYLLVQKPLLDLCLALFGPFIGLSYPCKLFLCNCFSEFCRGWPPNSATFFGKKKHQCNHLHHHHPLLRWMATPSKTCTWGRRGEATHRGGRRPLGGQEGRVEGTSVQLVLHFLSLNYIKLQQLEKHIKAKFTYDM